MATNLKELLNKPLPKDDKNRTSLFAVVAAFLALGGLGTPAWTIRL